MLERKWGNVASGKAERRTMGAGCKMVRERSMNNRRWVEKCGDGPRADAPLLTGRVELGARQSTSAYPDMPACKSSSYLRGSNCYLVSNATGPRKAILQLLTARRRLLSSCAHLSATSTPSRRVSRCSCDMLLSMWPCGLCSLPLCANPPGRFRSSESSTSLFI